MAAVWNSVADYVHSLGLDAYLVGGAVRDELLGRTPPELDFVVPGVGHAELRAALEPHGRVEDLVVADQRVGVRLLPRDKAARALQPAGIEFTPPRVERSTGPARHDFEIVADSEISLEQDMERRDFTINAIARRLETGEILDPLGGRADLERGVLRTTGPASFRDDPLRIVRGLRFVSQLDVEPDEDTLRQMREWAPRIEHVSAERIGGGLASDGMGELSKLLLGPHPAKALRLARDTGVLLHVIPEFEASIGYDQRSERQHLTLDEHIFAVVQAAADAATPLEVRLAALLHDLGKPEAERDGGDHAALGALAAGRVLRRLRYPTRLREYVVRLVREHPFRCEASSRPSTHVGSSPGTASDAPVTCSPTVPPISPGRPCPPGEWDRLDRFRSLVEQERTQPHRLADLAVDGSDLIAVGFSEGPALGQALQTLLDEVVEDPSRNGREQLLHRAKELV